MAKDKLIIDKKYKEILTKIKEYYIQNGEIDTMPKINGINESPKRLINDILIIIRFKGKNNKDLDTFTVNTLEDLGYNIEEQQSWITNFKNLKNYYLENNEIDSLLEKDDSLAKWLDTQIEAYFKQIPYRLSKNERKYLRQIAHKYIEERENTLSKQL